MSRPTATVLVTLADDIRRELRFERRHLYIMERRTGQTLSETFDSLQRGSYAAMVDLVWAGLLHDDPDLTPEDVTELVTFENLADVAEALSEALSPVTGKAKNADASEEAPPASESGPTA